MKSAYELAMEKVGKPRKYSDEQKSQLSEIDSLYESKKAQAKLSSDEELKKASLDPERQDEIRAKLTKDLKQFEEQKESEKQKFRKDKSSE